VGGPESSAACVTASEDMFPSSNRKAHNFLLHAERPDERDVKEFQQKCRGSDRHRAGGFHFILRLFFAGRIQAFSADSVQILKP
jgi:hypothetical protein